MLRVGTKACPPYILCILPADTAPFAALRNTGTRAFAIAEALHEDRVAVRFSMTHVWGEQARL